MGRSAAASRPGLGRLPPMLPRSVAGCTQTVLPALRLLLMRLLPLLHGALMRLRHHLAGHRVDLHFLDPGLLRDPDVERVDELSVLALQLMLRDLAARHLGQRRGACLLERNLGASSARMMLRGGHRRMGEHDGESGDEEEHEGLLGTIHGGSPFDRGILSTTHKRTPCREPESAARSPRTESVKGAFSGRGTNSRLRVFDGPEVYGAIRGTKAFRPREYDPDIRRRSS